MMIDLSRLAENSPVVTSMLGERGDPSDLSGAMTAPGSDSQRAPGQLDPGPSIDAQPVARTHLISITRPANLGAGGQASFRALSDGRSYEG
jgi:hypothetical protein